MDAQRVVGRLPLAATLFTMWLSTSHVNGQARQSVPEDRSWLDNHKSVAIIPYPDRIALSHVRNVLSVNGIPSAVFAVPGPSWPNTLVVPCEQADTAVELLRVDSKAYAYAMILLHDNRAAEQRIAARRPWQTVYVDRPYADVLQSREYSAATPIGRALRKSGNRLGSDFAMPSFEFQTVSTIKWRQRTCLTENGNESFAYEILVTFTALAAARRDRTQVFYWVWGRDGRVEWEQVNDPASDPTLPDYAND